MSSLQLCIFGHSPFLCFKVGFTSNIISNRYNLSLLGDPKFAEKGVSGARRVAGGLGPG